MTREKFPEKVPFRLTRMMIKAMEVSGIEGNFRCVLLNPLKVYMVPMHTASCCPIALIQAMNEFSSSSANFAAHT